jgi:ankyrin repeat protein
MAAEEGHARVVRMLLQAGAMERKSALIDAVNTNVGSDGNHEDVARALLAVGVNPNEPGDDRGILPLNTAAYRGNPEMVRILLKEGANPNLEDGGGETALENTRYGKEDQVKRILRDAINR